MSSEIKRTFKLKNVWQAKDLQTRFLDVWQGKDLRARFSYVWQGKDLREFAFGAGEWCDAGMRTGSVALTTNALSQRSVKLSINIIGEMVAVRTAC